MTWAWGIGGIFSGYNAPNLAKRFGSSQPCLFSFNGGSLSYPSGGRSCGLFKRPIPGSSFRFPLFDQALEEGRDLTWTIQYHVWYLSLYIFLWCNFLYFHLWKLQFGSWFSGKISLVYVCNELHSWSVNFLWVMQVDCSKKKVNWHEKSALFRHTRAFFASSQHVNSVILCYSFLTMPVCNMEMTCSVRGHTFFIWSWWFIHLSYIKINKRRISKYTEWKFSTLIYCKCHTNRKFTTSGWRTRHAWTLQMQGTGDL